jgi:galactosamine-6-phosphate isomerase
MKSAADRLCFRIAQDAEEAAQVAADLVLGELRRRPDLLLCVAAGSSPRRAYQLLGRAAQYEPALFGQLRVLAVDEWLGLRDGNPATCAADLRTHLLGPLGLPAERCQGFRTNSPDPEAECARVSEWLSRHGPIDVCVLGVGANGHLAMNEPAEQLCPHPHVAPLTPVSLQHPLLATCSEKPTHGLTLGMGDLLRSRKILLLACGPHKSAVLHRLRDPRVTTEFPVSFLWLHPDATVLADPEAWSSVR